MPDTRLIIIDPGHFHAALVQKEMYANLSTEAHVYAPLGTDLIDYLGRIARFNSRADQPTRWRLTVHAADVGLQGAIVSGMSFGQVDGRATWDSSGVAH